MNADFTRFDENETAANLKAAAEHWKHLADRAAGVCAVARDDAGAIELADAIYRAHRDAYKALRLAEMVASHHEAWACSPGTTPDERNTKALLREQCLEEAQRAISKAVHVEANGPDPKVLPKSLRAMSTVKDPDYLPPDFTAEQARALSESVEGMNDFKRGWMLGRASLRWTGQDIDPCSDEGDLSRVQDGAHYQGDPSIPD